MKIAVHNQAFKYISDNSREIDKTGAFLITKQNHKFIQDAKNNGCKYFLHVEECFKILNINNIKIIGITGTNGKTTTAAAIYSMLLSLGYKAFLQGTRGSFVNDKRVANKELTTPSILNTINNLAMASMENCDFFIMEVSSHAIAQDRIEGLKFYLKIFTNISQDHLDFHKTMENYIDIKNSFFKDDSIKLINKDDMHVKYNLTNTYTYAINNIATFKVEAYGLRNGIEAVCNFGSKMFSFSTFLQGKFNLYNILAAISAVYLLTKKDFQDIQNALEDFGGVSGRMEVVCEKPLIIIDFAHTPDGIEKVLESMQNKELVVVFGAGGDRDRTKRPLMGQIARKYAKKLYITSDNPRSENPESIISEIMQGINDTKDVFFDIDREKSIKLAIENLSNKEVLLILGKGDEEYQEINGIKYSFSDKDTVYKYLK